MSAAASETRPHALYTPSQRARRDATVWTTVQGVLAPVQFLVFAVSLVLVLRFLATGDGYTAATVSILLKTALLYTIMVTGAIWEKVVFGQYLFAPAFFWEDVVSFAVIALHTALSLWPAYEFHPAHAADADHARGLCDLLSQRDPVPAEAPPRPPRQHSEGQPA